MGLFSSRYEYFAYAGSSNIFELDNRPNADRQQILEVATGNGDSMADAIRIAINTDYFARAKAMMRYASKPPEEGGYVRGFPFARLVKIRIPDEAVLDAIEREIGERPAELLRNEYGGTFDERFFINHELQKYWLPQNDGDLNDGIFEWQEGKPPEKDIWCETFDQIQIPIVGPDGEYLVADNTYEFVRAADNTDIWDPEEPGLNPNPEGPIDGPTPGIGIPPALNYIYEVKWTYTNPETGADSGFSVRMNLLKYAIEFSADPSQRGLLIRATYLLEGDPCPRYWIYVIGSDVDPEFEKLIDIQQRNSQFLPVAVLQQDKVWFNEDPDSDLAITTNKLLKKLTMDGDEIRADYEEQQAEDDASGDADRGNAEQWDFFIHFAVPINSNVEASREYLHHFFNQMAPFTNWTRAKYEEYLEKRLVQDPDSLFSMIQPIEELTIREGFENGYAVDYGWSYIETQEEPGRIKRIRNGVEYDAPRGHCNIEILERNDDSTFARYQEIIFAMHGEEALIGPKTEDPERDGYHDFVYMEYQDRREGVWYVKKTLVMGLSMAYKINTREGANAGYQFRYAIPELFGTEEETKEFRIPISFPALKEVRVLKREDVITDALTATVFLVEARKVKWYQTGFFKWLIIVVAVILLIIVIFFAPYLAGLAGKVATATGFAATTIYNAMLFAIGFIVSFAGSLIGGTAGQIFSLIGVIATFGAGSINASGTWVSGWQSLGQGALSTFGGAMQFLTQVTNIANAAMKVVASYQLEELQDEMEEFLKTVKERQQELEDAWAGLGMPGGSGLDPLSLSQSLSASYPEKPEAFYSRTINLNPGVLGYHLIEKFQELALVLPENPGDPTVIDAQFETMAVQRGAM